MKKYEDNNILFSIDFYKDDVEKAFKLFNIEQTKQQIEDFIDYYQKEFIRAEYAYALDYLKLFIYKNILNNE